MTTDPFAKRLQELKHTALAVNHALGMLDAYFRENGCVRDDLVERLAQAHAAQKKVLEVR